MNVCNMLDRELVLAEDIKSLGHQNWQCRLYGLANASWTRAKNTRPSRVLAEIPATCSLERGFHSPR